MKILMKKNIEIKKQGKIKNLKAKITTLCILRCQQFYDPLSALIIFLNFFQTVKKHKDHCILFSDPPI